MPNCPHLQGALRLPSDLYDPRVPALRSLLPTETSFPAGALAYDDVSLAMLTQLGLRYNATPDALLAAALHVEALGAQASKAAAQAAAYGVTSEAGVAAERAARDALQQAVTRGEVRPPTMVQLSSSAACLTVHTAFSVLVP